MRTAQVASKQGLTGAYSLYVRGVGPGRVLHQRAIHPWNVGISVQRQLRIMTLAPGHFHAALIHKQMFAGIHSRIHAYGPLDRDTLQFVEKISQFNQNLNTDWDLTLCAGTNFLARFQQQTPGNTAVLAGRNRQKIDLMLLAARQNLDILADKPWIIRAEDFPKLLQLFEEADLRDLVIWDMMTERFDPLIQLQRELMRDPEIFGGALVGSPQQPTITLESIHYLKKHVAGQTLNRPAWWFDPTIAGTAILDVGTHLADLAMWLLFPEEVIHYQSDLQLLNVTAWPTMLDLSQYQALTGEPEFPAELKPFVQGALLHYAGNGTIDYKLRDAHVRLTVLWEYESSEGQTDLNEIAVTGSRSRMIVRTSSHLQELRIVPREAKLHLPLFSALSRRCHQWQSRYPGLSVHDRGQHLELRLPTALRGDHEGMFHQVVKEFYSYFLDARKLPPWERPNLLAKYWLTTQADLRLREQQA